MSITQVKGRLDAMNTFVSQTLEKSNIKKDIKISINTVDMTKSQDKDWIQHAQYALKRQKTNDEMQTKQVLFHLLFVQIET